MTYPKAFEQYWARTTSKVLSQPPLWQYNYIKRQCYLSWKAGRAHQKKLTEARKYEQVSN